MLMRAVCAIFVFFPAAVVSAGKGSPCTTPNGQTATCVELSSCTVIKRAVLTKNKAAGNFARESLCGYDDEPLVCCGSMAFKTNKTELGSSCITPNGDAGTCTHLSSCKVIFDATSSGNADAKEFAEQSKCDNVNDLVCCGSEGNFYQGSPLLPNRRTCGSDKATNRVTGGMVTDIGEFPWMVLLRYKNDDGTDAGFKCGGTLINNRYVLTAAHCVNKRNEFTLDSVRLGEWRISTEEDCYDDLANDECADPVFDSKIQTKISHPEYNPITKQNDIALLRLQKTVIYSKFIQPICLPHPNSVVPLEGTELDVAGWGRTENASNSDEKLKAKVPVVLRSECVAQIRQRKRITEKQVCAGGASIKDACQGDSGGPLMGVYTKTMINADQWYQEGIVSWGVGCGTLGVPAVYTRVAMYMNWITANLSD